MEQSLKTSPTTKNLGGDMSSSKEQEQGRIIEDQENKSSLPLSVPQSSFNLSDLVNLDVLPVNCNTITAELYKSKLGSGSRGACIKYKDEWLTPNEFGDLCGRGPNRNWKRSIKYGDSSLKTLIDAGILIPHEKQCTCNLCRSYDSSAILENEIGTFPFIIHGLHEIEDEEINK